MDGLAFFFLSSLIRLKVQQRSGFLVVPFGMPWSRQHDTANVYLEVS